MKKIIVFLLLLILPFSCDEDSKCNKCGNISGGRITMKITPNDLTRYQGLANVSGVNIGTCIQAYIYEEELFINSIIILDECCCEI